MVRDAVDAARSGDLAEATAGGADAEEARAEDAEGSPLTQLEREKAALEADKRRLERRLQQADAIIAFQKKVAELLRIPLKPFVPDEID